MVIQQSVDYGGRKRQRMTRRFPGVVRNPLRGAPMTIGQRE